MKKGISFRWRSGRRVVRAVSTGQGLTRLLIVSASSFLRKTRPVCRVHNSLASSVPCRRVVTVRPLKINARVFSRLAGHIWPSNPQRCFRVAALAVLGLVVVCDCLGCTCDERSFVQSRLSSPTTCARARIHVLWL